MNATKLFPSGAWEISTIHNGYRVSRVFMGYTKKQAMQLFSEQLKGE